MVNNGKLTAYPQDDSGASGQFLLKKIPQMLGDEMANVSGYSFLSDKINAQHHIK